MGTSINKKLSKKETPIIDIRSFNVRVEKRYRALKEMIIQAMREREGRYHIDYAEASDLAWNLAEQLPDGVDVPGDPGPDKPRWGIIIFICACIIALGIFAFIILYP